MVKVYASQYAKAAISALLFKYLLLKLENMKYMKIIALLRRYELVLLLQRTIWVYKITDLTQCFHGMQTFWPLLPSYSSK